MEHGLNTDFTKLIKEKSGVVCSAVCLTAHGTIEILKLFLNGAERQLRPYHILSWQSSY
jgi:hypothetical protein